MTTLAPAMIAESVRVSMRDGVELSAHVYRPAAGGPVPALLGYSPYRKGRLGAPPAFVEAGYAAVFFDVRGTGDSGGWNDTLYSDVERQDGYDMVEWAAAQPWCDGNVGMYGLSYGAVVALQMAQAAPPHLKAIIARSGSDDPYTEWTNPGGQPRTYMHECYGTIMTAFNFSPPDPEVVGERWAELWEERLRHNRPWGLSFIENLGDGPFWRARSLRDHYDDVRCAVFVVDGWADWYATPLLRIFEKLSVPKRALIGPWSHMFPDRAVPGPRIDWDREFRKWFDYWLKGIDTGVMDEPPVTLFVRDYTPPAPMLVEDAGAFRAEREWPLARQVETPWHLGDGTLEAAPAAGTDTLTPDPRAGAATGKHGGGPFSDNWMMPLDQRADEPFSLSWTGAALDDAVEITGVPRLRLRFRAAAETALFAAKLCDVAPDGTAALITKGFLNATHRNSHARPEPLAPGEVYDVEIPLLACAYRVAAGHRLRVMLAGADFLNIWPLPHGAPVTLFRDGSSVVLPVIPPPALPLPAPDLGASPHPLPRLAEMAAPAVEIIRDLITGRQTLAYTADFGKDFVHTVRYTVDPADPAHVTLTADARFRHPYPGRDILVAAQCDTTSDAQAFHQTVAVHITVNGQPYFQKHWATSVTRREM